MASPGEACEFFDHYKKALGLSNACLKAVMARFEETFHHSPSYFSAPYFASASALVQMAGYNSSAEALVGGVRPILVPRRNPRREQAIRASRLAAMGLADVVDEAARPEEVAWLLDRPRHLDADTVARAGLRLDGAQRAAERLMALATEASLQATR